MPISIKMSVKRFLCCSSFKTLIIAKICTQERSWALLRDKKHEAKCRNVENFV